MRLGLTLLRGLIPVLSPPWVGRRRGSALVGRGWSVTSKPFPPLGLSFLTCNATETAWEGSVRAHPSPYSRGLGDAEQPPTPPRPNQQTPGSWAPWRAFFYFPDLETLSNMKAPWLSWWGWAVRGRPQVQPGTPQADKKQLAVAEKTIGDLQRQSHQVAPLQQRRNPPQQPLHVDSICDWDSEEVQALPAQPQPCLLQSHHCLRSHPSPPCPSPLSSKPCSASGLSLPLPQPVYPA